MRGIVAVELDSQDRVTVSVCNFKRRPSFSRVHRKYENVSNASAWRISYYLARHVSKEHALLTPERKELYLEFYN